MNLNMHIYVTHSTNFDFKTKLYLPIRQSKFNSQHKFILPHEFDDIPFSTLEMFKNRDFDLILAEVSYPSTGQGIELGWANASDIPIICIHQKSQKYSGSLKTVSSKFFEYQDLDQVLEQVFEYNQHQI